MIEAVNGLSNGFKIQTTILSYLSAAEKLDIYPTLNSIKEEIPRHFMQEFALDTRIYERYESLGAPNEEAFLVSLQEGLYDMYSPNTEEIIMILDLLQFPFFDREGHVHNCVLQKVW